MRNASLLPLLLAPLLLPACSKLWHRDLAQTRQDFARICQAQKDFLEASKLKGVNEAELLVERTRQMRNGMKSEAAFKAVDLLIQPDAGDKRSEVEKAAKDAGLDGWACPELQQGP